TYKMDKLSDTKSLAAIPDSSDYFGRVYFHHPGWFIRFRCRQSQFRNHLVWIAWWTALKLFFIPFGGRSWCSICPIPMPGEWIQNGGILQPRGINFGLGKRWPKFLRGGWLQAGGFLMVGLFGAVTLTSPSVTSIV
ncbi:MAG: hypothetical protein ACYDH2_16550, partial [Anaerolineaceae bacterium]